MRSDLKIFQPQSMSNAKRCIDQRFAFKNSGRSCLRSGVDIQAEQSENDNPARKKRFQVARNDESYTVFFYGLIRTYGLGVKTSRSELSDMGSILAGC